MRITAGSLQRLKAAHDKLIADTDRETEDALEFAGRFAQDHVNRHPGFKPRTGGLQKATRARVVRLASGTVLKLTNNAKHAAAIDGGAKPHIISPKRGKFLRFVGRNGQAVFRRSVKHPGNRPYKFLYRATRASGRVVERNLKQRLSAIASRF